MIQDDNISQEVKDFVVSGCYLYLSTKLKNMKLLFLYIISF